MGDAAIGKVIIIANRKMSGALSLDSLVTPLYDFFVEKLPYVTLVVSFTGLGLRIQRWLSAPKEEQSNPLSLFAAAKYVVLDVVLFRKTFKTDKAMWLLLLLFHFSAAGILFGHMRGFNLWSAELFAPLGGDLAVFMVKTLPVYVGYLFIATTAALLVRRVLLEDRQLKSLPNDYIALVLLLITGILGQGMRLFPPEASPTHVYDVVFIPGLVVLHLEKVPSFHWFYLHTLFTQLFFMYIPFSKLVHIFSGVAAPILYGSRRSRYGIR